MPDGEFDMANAAAPLPQANMGEPAVRVDARLKVTGDARYPSDMPVGNPAYAYLVTSPVARGRIERLALGAALAVPGVLDILTQDNTGELKNLPFKAARGGVSTSIQQLGPEIAHAGQIVAVVIADTFEAAREAAHKVEVTYAAESPSATFGSPRLTEDDATKVSKAHRKLPNVGDAEAALGDAEVAIDVEYATPTQHHNPIELFTTTCFWMDDRLTILEPSQFVFGLKNNVAERLSVDPDKVEVISPFVGGAFGSKTLMTPRTALIALAAKRLNRPVKLIATRSQGFTISTYRAETRHHVRLGARRDGKLVGYVHEGWEISSRPDSFVLAGVENSAHLYAFGAVKTEVNVVHADRSTPGFMRSPPTVPYMYALETAMDELAVKLGMDPIELRRVNDTMTEPIEGKPFSSRSLMRCYDQAAESFGWMRRNPRSRSMREDDWLIGLGCATAFYPTNVGPATVRVRLSPAGDVRVQTAAHDLGTGAYTVIGQMAAERLGVSIHSVTVELGDSRLPPAPLAGGSNTTASTCSAVMKACDAIRRKLFHSAATAEEGALAGRDPAQLALRNGELVAHDGAAEQLEEAFRRLGTSIIEEYAEFIPHGAPPDAVKNLYSGNVTLVGGFAGEKMMYAMGAEFVEVRVHELTGEIRVPRIVGAFAAARLMNTRTAHSQLMGGMIWGIGSALHEATEIDPRFARYVNDNLADYSIPVNADTPSVKVILVSEEDHDVNPAGVKGLGELANVGTAAAISNAVYHATGIRVRKLPIRIEDMLEG
jgi:xanthine dehydrogenase YagR molybdenum-binding subunit